MNILRILCLGDVVGRPGRHVLKERLPGLRRMLKLDMIIANGENAAGGIGLTNDTFRELLGSGVDVITTGNHVWKHREFHATLDKSDRVVRPENYGSKVPGRGSLLFPLEEGLCVGVINLLGRTFMEPVDSPFSAADSAVGKLREAGARIIIADFHAEASSEKRAMTHYLDGKVSAVFGTHTHVQTADAYISDAGTASLTDLGMCGVERNSVIGMAKEKVLRRFSSGLPEAFIPAKGTASINGVIMDVHKETGKALSIRLVRDKPASVVAGDCPLAELPD